MLSFLLFYQAGGVALAGRLAVRLEGGVGLRAQGGLEMVCGG